MPDRPTVDELGLARAAEQLGGELWRGARDHEEPFIPVFELDLTMPARVTIDARQRPPSCDRAPSRHRGAG